MKKLQELSTDLLAKYKTAAAADASKADKQGDIARGNKRFHGVLKATQKQLDKFSQLEKPVKEETKLGPEVWWKGRHVGWKIGERDDKVQFKPHPREFPNHQKTTLSLPKSQVTIKEDLDEAHKIHDKVQIVGGPKDVRGKMGTIGEIRHGLYKGASKTYTIDYDHDEQGHPRSVQLKKEHIRAMKEEIELDEASADKFHAAAQRHKANADAALKKGDQAAYHGHMHDHHENMFLWHEQKKRYSSADREAAKAEQHHELMLKHLGVTEEVDQIDELSKKTLTDVMAAASEAGRKIEKRIPNVTPEQRAALFDKLNKHLRAKERATSKLYHSVTEEENLDESKKTAEDYEALAKKHTADGQKGTRANMVYASKMAGRARRAAAMLKKGGSQEDAWKHYSLGEDVELDEAKKRQDRYHIEHPDGKPASLASYADETSAKKDRDEKWPQAKVVRRGPRGAVKEEAEQLEEMPGANMDTRAVHAHLKKHGWSLSRTAGGHDIFTHEDTDSHIAVPRHRHLKAPLVRGILKMAAMHEELSEEALDEITQDLARSYYGKAESERRATDPFTKKGEYRDIAKRLIARRKKGIAAALSRIKGQRKTNEELELDDEKIKVGDKVSHANQGGGKVEKVDDRGYVYFRHENGKLYKTHGDNLQKEEVELGEGYTLHKKDPKTGKYHIYHGSKLVHQSSSWKDAKAKFDELKDKPGTQVFPKTNEEVNLDEAYTASGHVITNNGKKQKFSVKYQDFPSKKDIAAQNKHLSSGQAEAVLRHFEKHGDDDMSGTTSEHKAPGQSLDRTVVPMKIGSMDTHKVHMTSNTGTMGEETKQAKSSLLPEAVQVVGDNSYSYVHGGKPRGRGNWYFSPHQRIDFSKHKEGEDYINVRDVYHKAKAQARKWAAEHDHPVLHVQS